MKLLLFISTLCLFLIITQQSCTNNNSGLPNRDTFGIHQVDTVYITSSKSILGFWMGTYSVTEGTDAGEQDFYYSLGLHKDSTIQVIGLGGDGMTYYGIGTWKLNNTSFTAHIITTNLVHRGVPQTITAKYDSKNNKLSGTVMDDLYDYKAAFTLEKMQ